MSKKTYSKPLMPASVMPQLMAVPLAFFSAATAAAAVAGTVAGAAAASKVMSARPDEYSAHNLSAIDGVVRA